MQLTAMVPWLSPTFFALVLLAMAFAGTIGAIGQARERTSDAARLAKLDRGLAAALVGRMSTIATMIYLAEPAVGETMQVVLLIVLAFLGVAILITTIVGCRIRTPAR